MLKARSAGLAGATVLRGPMGFGHSSRLHGEDSAPVGDLPVVVEIIDARRRSRPSRKRSMRSRTSGLVTIEEIRVIRCRSAAPAAAGE